MEEDNTSKRKMVFIVNPVSGIGKQRKIDEKIDRYLDKTRFLYEIYHTTMSGHAILLTQKAIAENADIIVAVGGDGTVNEVGQGLIGTSAAMGIIPTGSGNGLARHLKIPVHPRKAIEIINKGRFRVIDTATVNDKLFLSMAGIGYDAFVARKFAKAGKRGFLAYFRVVSSEYDKYKSRKVKLIIDGQEITRKAMLVSFANSNQFGNNTSIDPIANIDDGLIDVCIVKKIPVHLLPFYAPLLFLKSFHKTRFIEIIKAKEAIVRRKKGKTIHLDGEAIREGQELCIKIQPKSLQIIVP